MGAEVEVTLADRRVAETFKAHATRLRNGLSSLATSSVWWLDGLPDYHETHGEPYVSARNELGVQIHQRVETKCSRAYVDRSFANPSRGFVVIDASIFPYPSLEHATRFATKVANSQRVDGRLAGVFLCLAVAPAWTRHHFALHRDMPVLVRP
jgi:hypothetical protein